MLCKPRSASRALQAALRMPYSMGRSAHAALRKPRFTCRASHADPACRTLQAALRMPHYASRASHAALRKPRFTCRASHAALPGPLCAVTRPPLTRQPLYPRAAGGTAPRVPARRRICGGHAAPVFQPPPCSPPLFRPAPKPRRTPYPLPRNTRPCPGPHCMCPVPAFLLKYLLFVFLVKHITFCP